MYQINYFNQYMKIAIIADVHFGVRNDSLFFLEKQKNYFTNIFFPYLGREGISTVICLGDLLDRRKYVNFLTLEAIKKCFIEPIIERGIDFHVTVGNHDSFFKNTLESNAYTNLFEGLDQSKIYKQATEVFLGGKKFLMVPWIVDDSFEDTKFMMENSSADICCGHFEPAGINMMPGIVNQSGIALSTFNNFDYTFSGHFHLPSESGSFVMVGSPLQYTWNDYGNKKRIVVYDTETGLYQSIYFDDDIFVKVYYDDAAGGSTEMPDSVEREGLFIKLFVANKGNQKKFDAFCDKINAFNPSKFEIIETDNFNVSPIIDNIEEKSTMDIVLEYIEELAANTDISDIHMDLQIMMGDLYIEAMSRRTF